MIKLRKIDLKKSTLNKESGGWHEHPDIVPGRKQYLCNIRGRWYAGSFSRQWYGLNFEAVYDAGKQYDMPGTGCGGWREVYEIREVK